MFIPKHMLKNIRRIFLSGFMFLSMSVLSQSQTCFIYIFNFREHHRVFLFCNPWMCLSIVIYTYRSSSCWSIGLDDHQQTLSWFCIASWNLDHVFSIFVTTFESVGFCIVKAAQEVLASPVTSKSFLGIWF